MLGLDLPTEAPEVPHFEVTLPGGLRLMWDTVESVRSFDPEFEPSSGSTAALTFDCGSPEAVDATLAVLVEAGALRRRHPGTRSGDSATRARSIPTETQHPRQRLRSVSVGPSRATTQRPVAPAEGRGDFRDGRAGGQRPREVGHRIVFVDRAPHGVDQCSDGIVLGSNREETHTP
ncbi:glyoxalase/bleomycin resistance protein/dioxygenase [Rhodococcus pyridinivorans AK37]|uniref:Glyoxalase/bleomycin resistance protein/dioxygenase n=1 Tax=Rhodococcus pyridinivorans AK37 TaxID=1114960 RepID=H0JSA8_9NOCA|nr:glyoxalase/bleomycin resistance protein/dioxygenase [Rhodococcus pyridinivorans AK37]